MSTLDVDEEYEDEVLHERRGTSVLRSAPPELVVPTPWMCRRWTGALNSRLWPRACAETGKRASMWQSCGRAAAPGFPAAVLGGEEAITKVDAFTRRIPTGVITASTAQMT